MTQPCNPCSTWVQATLEEVCEADLLLHVLDASSPDVQQQRRAVLKVSCTYLHCQTQLHADIHFTEFHSFESDKL